MLWILPVQRQLTTALVERVLDDRARKPQAPVVTEHRADRLAGFDAILGGIGKADFLENAVDRGVDLRDIGIGQRLVPAARLAGMHRFQVFGQRGPAQRNLRLAGVGTSCHGGYPGCELLWRDSRDCRFRFRWIQTIIFYSMH